MIIAILIVTWLALIATWIMIWRSPRANGHPPRTKPHPTSPRVEPKPRPTKNDLMDLARAVTKAQPVFIVTRKHTGKLDVAEMGLTADEALAVGTQLIQAALMTQYEHVGAHEAEAYANGEQS